MSATTSSLSVPIKPVLAISRPKSQKSAKTHHWSPVSSSVPPRKSLVFHNQVSRVLLRQKKSKLWRISATPEEISQEIVSSSSSTTVTGGGGDDGVSVIIQVLLLVAFVGLTILTIGVVYIGVSDFLGKREREKFEKEEAAKKPKKAGKKKIMKARASPRGFGQKMDEEDDDLS